MSMKLFIAEHLLIMFVKLNT